MKIYSIEDYREQLSDSDKEQLIRDIAARRLVYDMTRGADDLDIEELAERFGRDFNLAYLTAAVMLTRRLMAG
ncbi:MAG: hypothetical protein FWG13_06315 [Leptospirales bacterium]|nr:hypothetical protein [Leptospirales bacterium]